MKASASSTKMQVAVYARVSARHDNQKASIPTQIQSFKNYVTEQGWQIYDVYTDEECGSDSNRAGIQRLMKDAQENKFDIVIAKELSRISRDSKFLSKFYGSKTFFILTVKTNESKYLLIF